MILLSLLLPAASAFCGSYVGSGDTELYNSASEIVVVREGSRTTLTMANDYEGLLDEFAMIVPVPEILTEEDVRVVDPGVFTTLRRYSAPRLVSYTCDQLYPDPERSFPMTGNPLGCTGGYGDSGSDGDADSNGSNNYSYGVQVESRFIVGEYEIVILSAEESGALLGWLDSEGYTVPTNTSTLIQEYLDAGSYFFAARVFADRLPDGQDSLSPLQFGYDAEVFSLPIRLGTANSSGVQDLIIYGIASLADGRLGISNYDEATVPSTCLTDTDDLGAFYQDAFEEAVDGDEASWVTEYGWAVEEVSVKCDPCPEDIDAGQPISTSELFSLGFDLDSVSDDTTYGYSNYFYVPDYYFTRLHVRYTPEQATQDLTLYHSRITEDTQQRYIVYESYLENLYEICGSGWAKDPGSCADVSRKYARRVQGTESGCAVSRPSQGTGLAGLLASLLGLAVLRRRS
jgi:hypothetical protein